MLKKLPRDKFIQRTSGESLHYVYADPIVWGASMRAPGRRTNAAAGR
jgi:hypothetical protein